MKNKQKTGKSKKSGIPGKEIEKHHLFSIPGLKLSHFLFVAVILTILTGFSFFPSLGGEFTNWDDNQYVTGNKNMQEFSLPYMADCFSRFELGNYHPLTMISLSMNYKKSGPDPWPYHLTNLIFHILNTLLVYLLIRKLQPDDIAAVVTAILFGVQATRVEPVAWISARKEVLYAFFFLLSLITYLGYSDKKKAFYLVLSILFFTLGLLSKATAVVLAPLLVLIDLYKGRGRWMKKVILEKIPFFILAIGFGVLAILAQDSIHAIRFSPPLTFPYRFVMAVSDLLIYLQKLLIPYNLNAFYPWPLTRAGSLQPVYYPYALFFLLILAGTFYRVRKSWSSNTVLFGLLFFIIGLLPVLQILSVGEAAMADRYMYVPGIGIFLVIGLGISALYRKGRVKWIVLGAGLPVVLALVLFTRAEAGHWKDSYTLSNSMIERNPHIAIAYTLRGQVKEAKGDKEGSFQDYSEAIKYDSLQVPALNNRAIQYTWKGNFRGAEKDLEAALRKDPSFAISYSNLGFVYTREGRYKDALVPLEKALLMNSNDPMALGNRGYCRLQLGNPEQAKADLDRSLEIKADNPFAWFFRAGLHLVKKDTVFACDDYNKAMQFGYSAFADQNADSLFRKICR